MRNTFRLFQGNILSDIAIMIDMLRSDFSVRKVHEVLINFRFPNVDRGLNDIIAIKLIWYSTDLAYAIHNIHGTISSAHQPRSYRTIVSKINQTA